MPTATTIFSERIGRIEVSATMAVTAEAARLRSQGVQLADFGAGEPHFPTPRHIKDAAIAAIESNFTRYTVSAGIPELRKAIVSRHACDFGSDYTADETIFPNGTAFQCDVGMTGPFDSIIGRRIDRVMETTLTGRPTEFDVATGDIRLCGTIITADPETGRATAIC